MKETIKSIIEWHEQTFPDATLEGQIKKFYEEYGEVLAAEVIDNGKVDIYFELADCFIVACGVYRFSIALGTKLMVDVFNLSEKYCFPLESLETHVQIKMQINRNRKWQKKGNSFQHIEEGEEE